MCSTKFIESVNPEIANKLKYIGLNEFLNMVDPNNKEHYVEDNNYTSHLKMMRSYCNGDGNKLVEYKYGGVETSGRQYASSPSLQKIKREFRGALVDGIYYDFDMKKSKIKNIMRKRKLKLLGIWLIIVTIVKIGYKNFVIKIRFHVRKPKISFLKR